MSNDGDQNPSDKKAIHLDEAEHLPRDPVCNAGHSTAGRSHGLPAVSNSSQAAEVVKQIIEQILVNERRRARIEFARITAFFLIFLFVILSVGIWFARQLLVQLREERQLTERTWRMMAGGGDGGLAVYPADKTVMLPDQADVKIPPALNREEIAKLEQNVKTVSELLKTKPQSSSASVRDMLQSQQNAIQALSARLNETQAGIGAAPEGTRQVNPAAGGSASGGFIAAPLAEDLNLRMPIPSL